MATMSWSTYSVTFRPILIYLSVVVATVVVFVSTDVEAWITTVTEVLADSPPLSVASDVKYTVDPLVANTSRLFFTNITPLLSIPK